VLKKVLFLRLIAYAYVGVSLSDAVFMGGECLNESHKGIAFVSLLVFAPLFITTLQKKRVKQDTTW